MADIRKTTTIRDNFNRSPEFPLAGPTGVEWSQTESGVWAPMAITDSPANQATIPGGAGGNSANSYWNQETFDGDDAEVWAEAHGGGVISGLSFRLALWKTPGNGTTDGYYYRSQYLTGSDVEELWRVDNGGGSPLTALDSQSGTNAQGTTVLLRRNGTQVEVWRSASGHDESTWTQILGATDTTYTTDFYLAIGISDNSGNGEGSWDNFGGGGSTPAPPQIYRWIKASKGTPPA